MAASRARIAEPPTAPPRRSPSSTPPTASAGASRPAPRPQPSAAPAALSADQIAERAYYLWLRKGRPVGLDQQNWAEAEAELRAERQG